MQVSAAAGGELGGNFPGGRRLPPAHSSHRDPGTAPRMQVYTSRLRDAGTDVEVYLTLRGKRGESGPHELGVPLLLDASRYADPLQPDLFEPGQVASLPLSATRRPCRAFTPDSLVPQRRFD